MGKINILEWYFYKADDREEGVSGEKKERPKGTDCQHSLYVIQVFMVSGEKKKDQRELIASTAFM